MPCSNLVGKDLIKKWVKNQHDIKTILDIGPGIGTYYYLLKPIRPDIKFIAVEIWQPYVQNFMLNNYYDKVIIGDFREIDLPKADCVILGDVLEHVEKESAISSVQAMKAMYRHVIISIPWGKSRGGPALGNPYEEHKSFWTYQEVSDLTGPFFDIKAEYPTLGVFIK